MKTRLILCLVLVMMFLTSCASLNRLTAELSDDAQADQYMDDILSAIQNQDTDKILSLFAPNALADSGHNEDNVATLFDYCPRTFQDYDNWAGPNGEATKEDGKRTVILYGTYDVPSGAVTYRFAFKYITQDDNDEQNVGLWSLYVLAVEEEADLVYAYWGDDLFHPGIYIDIHNNEPTIES